MICNRGRVHIAFAIPMQRPTSQPPEHLKCKLSQQKPWYPLMWVMWSPVNPWVKQTIISHNKAQVAISIKKSEFYVPIFSTKWNGCNDWAVVTRAPLVLNFVIVWCMRPLALLSSSTVRHMIESLHLPLRSDEHSGSDHVLIYAWRYPRLLRAKWLQLLILLRHCVACLVTGMLPMLNCLLSWVNKTSMLAHAGPMASIPSHSAFLPPVSFVKRQGDSFTVFVSRHLSRWVIGNFNAWRQVDWRIQLAKWLSSKDDLIHKKSSKFHTLPLVKHSWHLGI